MADFSLLTDDMVVRNVMDYVSLHNVSGKQFADLVKLPMQSLYVTIFSMLGLTRVQADATGLSNAVVQRTFELDMPSRQAYTPSNSASAFSRKHAANLSYVRLAWRVTIDVRKALLDGETNGASMLTPRNMELFHVTLLCVLPVRQLFLAHCELLPIDAYHRKLTETSEMRRAPDAREGIVNFLSASETEIVFLRLVDKQDSSIRNPNAFSITHVHVGEIIFKFLQRMITAAIASKSLNNSQNASGASNRSLTRNPLFGDFLAAEHRLNDLVAPTRCLRVAQMRHLRTTFAHHPSTSIARDAELHKGTDMIALSAYRAVEIEFASFMINAAYQMRAESAVSPFPQ